jgi:hypothetical protein
MMMIETVIYCFRSEIRADLDHCVYPERPVLVVLDAWRRHKSTNDRDTRNDGKKLFLGAFDFGDCARVAAIADLIPAQGEFRYQNLARDLGQTAPTKTLPRMEAVSVSSV